MIPVPRHTDSDFLKIVLFVRDNYGINLEKKRSLVEARLSFDITKRGYSNFKDYLKDVTSNPIGEECRHMINRLSTNCTSFFREPDALCYTAEKFLPSFLERGGKHLSIWCAACSSGEEPYSLAMTLESTPQSRLSLFTYSILATDINTDLLERASKGVYPLKLLPSIPLDFSEKFAFKKDEAFQLSPLLMSKINWRYSNLLNEENFGSWDLIFCRNAMIYFRQDDREKLSVKFFDALHENGCLIVSVTESLDLGSRLFEHCEPGVYKKHISVKDAKQ